MFIIYGIALFLIIYFIYLIMKYSGAEKSKYNLQYFRDFETIKYPTIVIGYLNDKRINEVYY